MNIVARMYRDAGLYVRRCTGLFLLIVAAELTQHLVEYRAGFYDSLTAMKTAEGDLLRMTMGHAKVVLLFATTYWSLRFYAAGNDPAAPLRRDAGALRLFVPVMLWGLMWLLLVQDGPLLARAIGVPAKPMGLVLVAAILVSTLFEIALSAWKTAAATGDPSIGFVRSIRLMRGHWGFGLGVSAAAVLPAMVLHYALAVIAIGRPAVVQAAILTADSLLVGYMGPLMAASTFAVAQRVATAQPLGALAPD
jgi:hypothetical protein